MLTFLFLAFLFYLAYRWKKKRPLSFVMLDFETASSVKQSVCQVAMVVVEKGEIIHSQSWLIHPHTKHFSEDMIKIHGITYSMVKDSPKFNEVWPEIELYISKYKAVAAHYAHFDIPVLLATLDYYGIPSPRFIKIYDSCIAARRAWPILPNHKLPTVAASLNIPLNHHDALSDAKAAALILIAAHKQLSRSMVWMDVDTACNNRTYKQIFFDN